MSATLPPHLRARPFTRAEALTAGITDAMLRHARFSQLFRGIYILASVELTLEIWCRAALRISPVDTVVSHVTALRVYGFSTGAPWPIHISTRTATHTRQKGIRPYQRKGRLEQRVIDGIAVTTPERTIVDIATKVRLTELVQASEWMIHQGWTTLEGLAEYALASHLDGVRRLRRVLGYVREGVESPMETLVRLMLVFARLPEPACNLRILDSAGYFLARGDLVYADYLVLVEYDGWHHERNAAQRQHDLVRRESLEAAGWRIIVIMVEDLKDSRAVVRRVHRALVSNGYDGRAPHFNVMWDRWFA